MQFCRGSATACNFSLRLTIFQLTPGRKFIEKAGESIRLIPIRAGRVIAREQGQPKLRSLGGRPRFCRQPINTASQCFGDRESSCGKKPGRRTRISVAGVRAQPITGARTASRRFRNMVYAVRPGPEYGELPHQFFFPQATRDFNPGAAGCTGIARPSPVAIIHKNRKFFRCATTMCGQMSR